MGDTVAHAARSSEDQDPAVSRDCAKHPPGQDTPNENSAKQNGDVLSEETKPVDASPVHVEGQAKEGGGSNECEKADAPTGNHQASACLGAENDKALEENVSLSKDGSSENISSIENDVSVGCDGSFDVSTNPGDVTSPETETCPEIGEDQLNPNPGGINNADSPNETPTRELSPENDATEADNQVSEMSSESGFVEGSAASDDTEQNATARPASDKATKNHSGPPVCSPDKPEPRRNTGLRIPPTPSKATMEQELEFLREEVRDKTASVQRLQTSLYDQQVRANVAMVALRTQLRKKDRDSQHLRQQHEQRMSALLSHLLYLEGQMRKEQRQVLELVHEKNDVIRRQKSAIEDLASKNARLLAALKEVHGYSGGNGISSPHTPATPGEGEKGAKGVLNTPVVLRNKDKGQKVRFGSVKDKLRRHKSSLELHRPASLDTLVEGTLRYGSQENLSGGNQLGTSAASCRKGNEGLCSDELKKTRQQERKERCKSLIDYPFRLNDLPEVSSEVEKGREESPLPDPLQGQSLSCSPRSPHSSQYLCTPQGRNSLHSDDEEAFLSPGEGGKQYGELAKSTSMPQCLSSPSDPEVVQASVKERPHSLSGVELSLNMDKMTMMPMEKVSMNPSPTSQVPPGGSESNPFKSFKNVFRRRNSKQRSKKRPASLGQQTNQEYHEALKEHFKKYDLN